MLLIPEPIISFRQGKPLDANVIGKLKSVLPEDDRCVVISDPLEIVLDRLMHGEALNPDVRYMINRMAALREAEGFEDPTLLFNLRKSLGAYTAQTRSAEQEFEQKIDHLKKAIADETPVEIDTTIAALASQSGLSTSLLLRLKKRIADSAGSLPMTVEEWLIWTVQWLAEDHGALESLLYDVKGAVLGACGRKRDGELDSESIERPIARLARMDPGQAPLCN